ncbi:MAG: 3-oxoacyl-ACP reductase FabG [Proteobacteria bacterium]|nr:3-oxoacyl-ACP reductase FabG [Pseudomonadota bacterium]
MTDPLHGKAALVTGGSRGIGAAIAQRLAADGADVAITYARSPEAAQQVLAAIKAKGVRGEGIAADAADAAAMTALVPRVVERLGRLDILVNNAGIFFTGPLEQASDDEFRRMIDVNVRAVFLAGRGAARVMGPGGRIINVGSIAGERAPFPGLGLYSMSKFAVAGLTQAWARDLAPKQITVNCIQPGPIATDMNPADGPFADAQRQMVPLGRLGKPTEIAAIVAMLARPEASFITGATLNVDGGMLA